VSSDIVIRCSPSKPPFALAGLVSMLSNHMSVFTSVHSHSGVVSLPSHLHTFLPQSKVERGQANIKITLIWKEVGNECELMVSPMTQTAIKGEVNLIRYFARCFPSVLAYENDRTVVAVDNLLDSVTSLLWAPPRERQPILRPMAVNLAKSSFLNGEKFGIADLALFSAIKQLGLESDLQPELRKWFVQVTNKLMGGKGRRKSRASSSRQSTGGARRRFSERRTSERKNSERGHKHNQDDGHARNKKERTPKNNNNNNSKRETSPKKTLKPVE